MIDADELTPLVERWLPAQRWFAGKGRRPTVDVAPLAALTTGPAPVEIWLARATYDDGGSETYQLPLVSLTEPVDTLDHVLLGSIKLGDGDPTWIYDALHDKDVTSVWLDGIRDARVDGSVRFTRYVAVESVPSNVSSLVLTGEQSNTSLMYGDLAILKVFRRLQPGTNPDIEIHAALGDRGARHVARLLGAVEADHDGATYALAMLQEFMTTATDGWELAKASVRDLMAEADLHADEAGGDFAGEAHRLGAAVAETHADLAAAFGTSVAETDDLGRRASGMQARLDAAIGIVPELRELAGALRAAYADLERLQSEVPLQRIHGDLHLGQALRTAHRWVIIDFEGEPMGDLSERRHADSPLRDVAGMLRSFDYAGHHRLIESGPDAQLTYRAAEWTQRNATAFCDGYAEIAGADPRDHAVLLRAFEADKAVYEAVYEARNRPSWLPIPLASLSRLADQEAPQ
ncbi:MAG TPA: aminoglycoside phosphotransferase [Jatrophihabitantaceae bacterium]|nr:aminoglycoside phosphotransferase [Jatrophihabitantaceae bacterium]